MPREKSWGFFFDLLSKSLAQYTNLVYAKYSTIKQIMDFNKFQEFFEEFEHDNNSDPSVNERRLMILSLGLAGESGETIEILKKYFRNGDIKLEHLEEELGDVLAYVSMIGDHFGLSLEDIAKNVIAKNKKRREKKEADDYYFEMESASRDQIYLED